MHQLRPRLLNEFDSDPNCRPETAIGCVAPAPRAHLWSVARGGRMVRFPLQRASVLRTDHDQLNLSIAGVYMGFSVRKDGDTCVVAVEGQLIVGNRQELKQRVLDELERGERKF